MIKRPLVPRFVPAVLAGIKITTIREKPWPVGPPIMLYHWSGSAYRSKHLDVAPVIVESVKPITITRPLAGFLRYEYGAYIHGQWLWQHEGFRCRHDMDAWFSNLIKPGQSVTQLLMRFRLADPE